MREIGKYKTRNLPASYNDVTVTKTTESSLIKTVGCNYIVKGVLKITINDRVLKLDFGTGGSCDDKALLTWANGSVEISL